MWKGWQDDRNDTLYSVQDFLWKLTAQHLVRIQFDSANYSQFVRKFESERKILQEVSQQNFFSICTCLFVSFRCSVRKTRNVFRIVTAINLEKKGKNCRSYWWGKKDNWWPDGYLHKLLICCDGWTSLEVVDSSCLWSERSHREPREGKSEPRKSAMKKILSRRREITANVHFECLIVAVRVKLLFYCFNFIFKLHL